MGWTLSNLPPEIYSSILDHLPSEYLQSTTLALSRAVPLSPISLYHLFRDVRLEKKERVGLFARRLRKGVAGDTEKCSSWVRSFSGCCWDVDADVLINVINQLPNITSLHLNIGTTFAPEHLAELFSNPSRFPHLRTLSLRFRPYVERATYYQFLKGSYFDSTISLVSVFPGILNLSITQDPLPVSQKRFAQPIVFFSLKPFLSLSSSPSITHLRLRIPSRPILLASFPPNSPYPSLEFLDISGTSITSLSGLQRLWKVRHILMNDIKLNEGEWETVGRMLVMGGMEWAKEMESEFLLSRSRNNQSTEPPPEPHNHQDRPRRGRRGLASATISLRTRPLQPSQPTLSSSSVSLKLRILPPAPHLLTFSTSSTTPDWQTEFEKGWNSGVDTLRAVWKRLIGLKATRIMVWDDEREEVRELDREREEVSWEGKVPVLCAGGRGREEVYKHQDGCGHGIGVEIWGAGSISV